MYAYDEVQSTESSLGTRSSSTRHTRHKISGSVVAAVYGTESDFQLLALWKEHGRYS